MFDRSGDRLRERVAVAALLLITALAAFIAVSSNGADAVAYRSAAERLLATGSPYSAEQLAGPYDPAGGLRYLYPPTFALLLAPLLLLPTGVTIALFAVTSIVASYAACYLVLRHGGLRRGLALPAAVLAVVCLQPALDDAINGNVSALLAFAVAVIIAGSPRSGGIAGAAVTILKLTPAALLPAVLLRGRRAVGAAVATGALLVVVTLPFLRAWTEYPTVIANLVAFGPSQRWTSSAPADIAGALLGTDAYGPARSLTLLLAAGLLALTLLAVLTRRRESALVAGLYGSLLLPATLWTHYLLAPAVLTLSLAVRSGGRRGLLLLVAGAAALTLPFLLQWPPLLLPALPLLIALSIEAALRLDAGQRSDIGSV